MRVVRAGLSRPGVPRALLVYLLLAVLGTALLFLLHYFGNLLPRELAEQRFRHEIATTNRIATHPSYVAQPQWGIKHIVSPFWYCEQSLMVLTGALRDGEKPSFEQAVLLRQTSRRVEPRGWYCTELLAMVEGVSLPTFVFKTRYLWGSKALYAIGLNRLSVTGIHQLIEIASWVGWGVLAGAMLLLGWRAFLVAAPLPVFGGLFSGIGYFSETGFGIPYAWSLFAAALFAWLLSRSGRRPSGTAARVFCFVAGMISSWFWFYDGSEFMLIALLGLIGWLGSSHLEPRARFFRVTGFMALWVGGFIACFALSMMTKSFVHEWFVLGGARDSLESTPRSGLVAWFLFDAVEHRLDLFVEEFQRGLTLVDLRRTLFVSNYLYFERMAATNGIPEIGTRIITLFTLFSALAAGCLAMLRGEAGVRCRPDLLWFLCLMGIVGFHFLLPTDIPFLESRWVFLVLALSWSCLIAALIARTGVPRRPAPHGSAGGRDAPAH